ncbi:hypothetical protein V8E55_008309 [Tylopilus felleus]
MSSPTSLRPDQSLPSMVSFRVGIYLQDILYARSRARWRSDIFYTIFSSVMFLLVTLVTIETFDQGKVSPNQNRAAGQVVQLEAAIDVSAVVIFILQQMTDGLIMYRCRIVWGGCRFDLIPSILWLTASVSGILVLWNCSMTETDFFSGLSAKFGLTYYSSSCIGEEYAVPYFSIMRLLVESVLPLTLSGIAFLVSYGIGSPSEVAVPQVYSLMMCVSPQITVRACCKDIAQSLRCCVQSVGMLRCRGMLMMKRTSLERGPNKSKKGGTTCLQKAQNHINRTAAVSDKRMVSVLMNPESPSNWPTLLLKSDYKIAEAGLFVACISLHHVIQFNYFRLHTCSALSLQVLFLYFNTMFWLAEKRVGNLKYSYAAFKQCDVRIDYDLGDHRGDTQSKEAWLDSNYPASCADKLNILTYRCRISVSLAFGILTMWATNAAKTSFFRIAAKLGFSYYSRSSHMRL